MSMLRWDPFADMAQLREQVNRLFAQSQSHTAHKPVASRTWAPAVDIYETENTLVLRIDAPGANPHEVDIQISGDTLTIKGERTLAEEQGVHYLRIERSYGPFQRAFTLGMPVDEHNVRANYRDGVLEITLPKQEHAKSKQVKVEVQDAPRTTGKEEN
ncbi:MAG: Hsp20/alpha crystallin family protein [Armatimonadota bacterium]